MVTFIYFLVLISLLTLMSLLDMAVYQQSFMVSVYNLLILESGTRRMIVVVSGLLGFISSCIIDYHHYKQKRIELDEKRTSK